MKTLLIFFWASCIACSVGVCQQKKDISYRIPGNIPVMKQPKGNDCWITVTTMMLSWKDKKTYTIKQVVNKLGDPWKGYYEKNTGLNEKDQESFTKLVGFTNLPPANHLLEVYLDLLKQHGPVWVTTGDGFSAHARVLIGIEGNGDYNTTQFVFIDPFKGKVERQSALSFMKEFEQEAYVANEEKWERLRIQIYHF